MIKFLKTSAIIILVILLIATLVLISFKSMISIIAASTGVLFMYYLIVLFNSIIFNFSIK
ncbi:hypothetical protein [Tenacibaculum sp. 1_MG-2023]|uniref:hypothetical protein n=1 Tax=Tenacibaculum sp. 1_MG-2023 TaxID=3062653 RepID=UPI0026E46833|nr:hypothetical protein [Tenacibaculum sp. 1_MG-2023]MCH3880972.1 hypothetical protein [Tenacibaculum aquimarinum]